MWYELSSSDTYLLQAAIRALRSDLYHSRAEMPSLRKQYDEDLAKLEDLSVRLYDDGRWPPDIH